MLIDAPKPVLMLQAGYTYLSERATPTETYGPAKPLVDNPRFQAERRKCLVSLNDGMIDPPIVDLVNGFNSLPFGYTIQGCYGHFVFPGQTDPDYIKPLPRAVVIGMIDYRIAYLWLAVQNSEKGWWLTGRLDGIIRLDP